MTMAEGCPPRWMGLPTVPVASVTGTSDPASRVIHAVVPSVLRAIPWATSGRVTGGVAARPAAPTVMTPAPPHT